jgi:hypothetical protein
MTHDQRLGNPMTSRRRRIFLSASSASTAGQYSPVRIVLDVPGAARRQLVMVCPLAHTGCRRPVNGAGQILNAPPKRVERKTSMDTGPGLGVWIAVGIVVYEIVMGFVGAYVAEEKGRSTAEGALFAIFFGPLGLILEACMPTRARLAVEPSQEEEEESKVRANLEALALQRLDSAELVRKRRQDAK